MENRTAQYIDEHRMRHLIKTIKLRIQSYEAMKTGSTVGSFVASMENRIDELDWMLCEITKQEHKR
jgi:hypothetical protein